MVFFKTPCIPFLDCECFSERTFYKNCLVLFSSTLHLNFYQLVKSSVQMMGENTRRVAKIISFEVSSVDEMIKMDVYLVNTHTQGYIFLQKKHFQDTSPLFSKNLLFFSFSLHAIFSLQYLFYNIMPHLVTRRRRRRKIKSPTKRIGRGCTFYILKCSFFNLLLWTFLSINNNNISRRCDINEKKDFLSFMRHFFPR